MKAKPISQKYAKAREAFAAAREKHGFIESVKAKLDLSPTNAPHLGQRPLRDVSPDYFLDNYGSCQLDPCTCLDPKTSRFGGRWAGRGCPDWQPSGATSFAELMQLAKTANPKKDS